MTNREIVLRFYDEVFNRWDLSCVEELMRLCPDRAAALDF